MAVIGSIDPNLMQQYLGNGGVVGPGTLAGLGDRTNPGQVMAQGPMITDTKGGMGKFAGMDETTAFMQAVKDLGIDVNNASVLRGHLDTITNYLQQNGGGTWQTGGAKADDWLKGPSGEEYDALTAGGKLGLQRDNYQNGVYQGFGNPGGAGGQGGPMGGGPGALMDDPGYQFQLGEGLKALQRSAAARGTLLTGGTLKGLEGYAQNFANTAYQNAFNRNLSVANLGLGAANSLAGLGSSYGNAAGSLYGDLGNAQAAGTVGKTNPWLGAFGNIGNAFQQQAAGQMPPGQSLPPGWVVT